jgi:hypothetical protein
MRLWRWSVVLLLGATAVALGGRLSFQEYAVVQESLSRVHPRMRASWLRAHGLDDSYYTTFRKPESTGLVCRGRWPWGPSWELAGRDTFLYLGSGSGVRILSMADSVQPRMLGQVNARGLVSQVVVQDSLLFVACGSWGAQIYSVSNPANPRELGSMDAVISDVCVKDSFCYAVGGDSLRIYNVTSPSLPNLVGAIRDSGDLVVVANGYAFSAGRWVMNIYNVTDPAHPTWVNSRGGPAYAMFVRRNLLFCSSVQPDNMTVLNISDPLNITQVSKVDGYGGEGLYVDASCAYMSCTYGHHGLFVVDMSDSSRPVVHDSIDPEGAEEWEPYVPRSPGYGYLADAHGGLVTVDVHNVDSISEAWSGYKADQAVDIHVDGGLAYIANHLSGLQLVDVADPTNPVSLGIVDFVGAKITSTATARDSFAFIAMTGITGRRYLRVVDVLDPTNPQIVAQESCYNPPEDYVLRDSLLYAAEANQFQIFNVARPREPVLVGSCAGDGVSIVLRDTFAYTAAGAIRVTNVARPDSPFVVTTVGRSSWDLSIVDSMLFCQPGPAIWYSLANPAVPVPIDSIDMGHWITGMTAVNRTIYACSGPSYTTLYAISIADIHQPRVIDQTTLPYTVKRITYAAPYLYLSCWEAGVAIYETTSVGIGERPAVSMQPACLRIWPNVTSGKVRFTLGVTARAADIAVFDISGKRLDGVPQQSTMKGGATKGVLDLTGLAAGVYVLRVKSEGENFTAKVVKANRR